MSAEDRIGKFDGGENFVAGQADYLVPSENHILSENIASDRESREREFTPEELSLLPMVNLTIETYASRAMRILADQVRKRAGKDEINSLKAGKNYKLGDIEISIDPTGENILHDLIDSMNLPAVVEGEHQDFESPTGEAKIHFVIDPFDNTSEYKASLPTPPWTVVSAYAVDGKPMASFVGNIKDNRGYFLKDGKIFEQDLDNGEKREVRKSNRKSLMEEGSVLASYTGSSEYSKKFNQEFNDFTGARPPKALFHGGGGAFIYGPLAAGIVDAYAMFNEPHEEIGPGAAIALEAGCVIGHYNLERDEWVDYRYNPNRDKKNEKTVDGLFVAAATPEIRDEIVGFYRERNLGKGPIVVGN